MWLCSSVCVDRCVNMCVCKKDEKKERESTSVCIYICVHTPTTNPQPHTHNIPHLRCLLMHQSLRPSVIAVIRFSPLAGIHSTCVIASSAASRNPATDANHCVSLGAVG